MTDTDSNNINSKSGKTGKLLVIVAPSGTGKSTLIKKALLEFPSISWSISCTTRPMREGEEEGKDYYFVSINEFEENIKHNRYIEYAKVHSNYYGTLRSTVNHVISEGKNILLDLDVQGCLNIKKLYPTNSLIIFIRPPSIADLKKRLIYRGTDPKEVIDRRVENAIEEMKYQDHFDFKIVNDEIEKCYEDLKAILVKELNLASE